MRFLLLLTLTACGAPRDTTYAYRCRQDTTVLAPDAPGDAGFSGEELYVAATGSLAQLDIAWQGDVTPSSDTFELTFGPIAEVRQVTVTDDACTEDGLAEMQVDVEVDLASVDGEVAASGVATLISVSLGAGVFLTMDLDAAVTGAHADAVENTVTIMERTYVAGATLYEDGLLHQIVTIGVAGRDGETGHNASVYACYDSPDADCLTTVDE